MDAPKDVAFEVYVKYPGADWFHVTTVYADVGDEFFDCIPPELVKILERHEDNFDVEDWHDGSCFTVTLPFADYQRVLDFIKSTNSAGGSTMHSDQNFVTSVEDMEVACTPTPNQLQGVTKMSQAKLIDNVTYFRGRNVKDLSKEQLINGLKELEAEIRDLQGIKTQSTAIAAQIEKLNDALQVVVAELDSRS